MAKPQQNDEQPGNAARTGENGQSTNPQPAFDQSRSSSGTSNYVRSSYVDDEGKTEDSMDNPTEENVEKIKDNASVPNAKT